MIKNIKLAGIFVLMLSLTLAMSSFSASAANITLDLGHESPADAIRHRASVEFAEKVEELSDGEVRVEVFSDAALGSWREMQEAVQTGTLDINVELMDSLGRYDRVAEIPSLPYVFDAREEIIEIYSGELGEEIKDVIAEETGYRVLGHMARTPRVYNTRVPVESLEDMEGLKIRSMDAPNHIMTHDALGADPTPMAFPEVYTSIETGVIDGHENPYDIIYHNGIHEVAPYITNSNHMQGLVNFIFWDDDFQQLPGDVQEILYEAADHASEFFNDSVEEEADELVEIMKEEGVTFFDLDDEEMERFRETVLNADIGMDHELVAYYVERILER